MIRPKVSIIVPIFNVEQYLERCIQTLIYQTLKEIEIILVDDESPDKCPEMCDKYAKQDLRIKVIHKKNEGLGFARNSGIEVASGEFVAFVDSDDFVDLTMFEKLYDVAKQNSLDTVFCGFNQYHMQKTVAISEVSALTIYNGLDIKDNVLLNMIAGEPEQKKDRILFMSVWHGIYSNELIQKNNIYFCSERNIISEDIVFHLEYLIKSQHLAYIPDCLYYYCFNSGSVSRVFRKDRNDKIISMYHELMQKADSLNWKINEKQRIMRLFIGYSRSALIDLCCSNLSFNKKLSLVHSVCSNDVWKDVLNEYPYKKLPFVYSIFTILIKYKLSLFIYLLAKIKNNQPTYS